jgi:arylsulfatase A-like enzyme
MSLKQPNIVLIVLDTVGAKHLSLYGYQRPTTPNLERIAGECSVYTRCFAPACWTMPSHASMFTGLYPSQHGAFESRFLLRDNLPHLVPALKAQGYTTTGFGCLPGF